MGRFIDLSGQRFGRLMVVEYVGKNNQNRAIWKCLCDCGNETIVRSDALRSGDTQSCGCLNSENKSKECIERNIKHGLAHTRLYRVWCSMRRRCNDTRLPDYKNYGARGIRVCAEWDGNFQAFNDWAMKNGYDETAARGDCTIDRIDVNGNYCPDNCRFVNLMVQGGNKRNNKRITHNGITMTQSEWGRYYGKDPSFFCDDSEVIEKKMNGCDEYIRVYGYVPKYVHCVKLSAEYARRKF